MKQFEDPSADPYVWLENANDPKALSWVSDHNQKTLPQLQNDARYTDIHQQVAKITLAPDRLPSPRIRGQWVYNFWQDSDHVRGIWRRATFEEFSKKSPNWMTLIDVDALSKTENENWVWSGANCLAPEYDRCLISLSRGGKDAIVVREFNIASNRFMPNGFVVPEAKTNIDWIDQNTVLVGTNTGPNSLTNSGYPREVRLWKRGTPISSAKLLLAGLATDVEVNGSTTIRPEGSVTLLSRGISFFETEVSVLQTKGTITRVPFPTDADFETVFQGYLFALLRSDWKVGGKEFPSGALVSLPLKSIADSHFENFVEIVYNPDSRSAFMGLHSSQNYLYLTCLENVWGHMLKIGRSQTGWTLTEVSLPTQGSVEMASSDDFSDKILIEYESFLIPTTIYVEDPSGGKDKLSVIKKLADRFEASDLMVEQFEATSADGTQIPYFLVHKSNYALDGNNPTLLYGYGGFEISETPTYLGTTGKVWLEKGGVYALANIRGGGEFGPKWHEAAMTVNRQRAYDDFAAVAQDLIRRNITSTRRLGIQGGSNGGLLMGVALTQHPELYRAVLCEVALLDMLRYPEIAAGSSWMGEYGDPSDPKMWSAIKKYSPYQNVKADGNYPKVFFTTSTADDRVGPGHSRKMVARMEEQGHPVLFYESIEGGHPGAANLDESVTNTSLEFTYLFQQLVD